MIDRLRTLAFLLATTFAAMAPALAQPVPDDATIQRKLAHQLQAREDLKQVSAQVTGGVATLNGQVVDTPQRQAAAEIATSVDGVRQVNNQIMLDPDLPVRIRAAVDELKGKLVRLVVNLPLLVLAILVIMFSVWLGGFISRRMQLVKRLSRHNPYMDGLVRNIVKTLVVLSGVLIALNLLGATSLVGAVLGSAGVVGLALGFAFKDIAENYISGILLSFRQPFSPGDLVRIDSSEGRVVALTSRVTVLMTADGLNLQLPNALVFKSVITNYTRNSRRRFDFITNVSTSSSWNDAMDLGIGAIRGVAGVLADPAPSAWIRDLSDSGATIQFAGWIDQANNDLAKTRSEAMRMVRRTLRGAGILPPSSVQQIQLVRSDGDAHPPPVAQEVQEKRDTSVDREMDASVQEARAEEIGSNLLNQAPPK
ncbi:mechanosensitive ion channel family protein [Solilutibacter silvestris]|uniref:Small-conductance mechanosensitive channel n=1 Tax=Solilutibacter silvestris TaxID=1645665 RepID=A0A2K1PYA4_9GAMM|nr:mechanosensitive ion channel family protein [Lysobacter silvestris]PNS07776.1 Mechanosensitive ion channel [Lysobacter silvestris]